MKIILANGIELDAYNAFGGREFFQGASRDAISFVFPKTESIIALDEAFTEENCERIIIDDMYVHRGYTIRVSIAKETVEVEHGTDDTASATEERITVKMAQRTYAETQLSNLVTTQKEQDDALIELAELIVGGLE